MRKVSENRASFDSERAVAFESYRAGGDAAALLSALTAAAERAVMREAALHKDLPAELAFCAVGGFGRSEMYPFSDLDVMVLVPEHLTEEERRPVQSFLTSLWDLGLTVGASERTVKECLVAAEDDITVCTALLEARLIGGDQHLFSEFRLRFLEHMRPGDFFRDKMLEMHQRHARSGDSPYALEPNVKESPGGLRDLQVLIWVARAYGFGSTLQEMARSRLITAKEAAEIRRAELFLRKLRITLHLEANRHEDRLLFDLQSDVAAAMGFRGDDEFLASESLMKSYYINAKSVVQLVLILLHVLSDSVRGDAAPHTKPLDDEFGLQGDEIVLLKRGAFRRHPEAILKYFLLRAKTPGFSHTGSSLLREMWHVLRDPSLSFEMTDEGRSTFLSILRLEKGVYRTLRDMNTWGVLDLALPGWKRIDGQMQHDLFHIYTVDQHTIQVVRGLRHFVYPEHAHEFPLLSKIMVELPEQWRLICAALFHDIGKGMRGEHERIGAQMVRDFCSSFGISQKDNDFITFLVREHLTMSHTAQKEDISDPEVVGQFAARVKTRERLDALYLLTVCDIRATGPKVWNNWKGQLLERLYRETAKLLSGTEVTRASILDERKSAALAIAESRGVARGDCLDIWKRFGVDYFLRHTPEDIAWHACELGHWNGTIPLVRARPAEGRAGYEILVVARDEEGLFSRLVSTLQKLSLSILDAKIHTTADGVALDTFLASDAGRCPDPAEVVERTEKRVAAALMEKKPLPPAKLGSLSRRSRHFPIRPVVLIEPDERGESFLLTLACNDRLGLLYLVSTHLMRHGINLVTARISTLGERVEDVFQITGERLNDASVPLRIASDLLEALEPPPVPERPGRACAKGKEK